MIIILSFDELILTCLSKEVINYKIHGKDEISIKWKDVNLMIEGLSWEELLMDYMDRYDYELKITYGDGNWVDIKGEKFNR